MPQYAEVQKGSTTAAAKKVRVFLTRSDTGQPLTGVNEAAAGANFKYSREGVGSFTAIDFTASGVDLVEIGEGYYDIVGPDAFCATLAGVSHAQIAWSGVANMFADSVFVTLTDYDPKAAPDTASTIAAASATAVDAALADNFGALPASVATAVDAIVADNFSAVLTAIAGVGGGSLTVTDILAGLAGVAGNAARAAIGEDTLLTIVGAKDLRVDDSGSTLTVVRKSTSATVATPALRRGDRTQTVTGNG